MPAAEAWHARLHGAPRCQRHSLPLGACVACGSCQPHSRNGTGLRSLDPNLLPCGSCSAQAAAAARRALPRGTQSAPYAWARRRGSAVAAAAPAVGSPGSRAAKACRRGCHERALTAARAPREVALVPSLPRRVCAVTRLFRTACMWFRATHTYFGVSESLPAHNSQPKTRVLLGTRQSCGSPAVRGPWRVGRA